MSVPAPPLRPAAALAAALSLVLTGCGQTGTPEPGAAASPTPASAPAEAADLAPRLVITHDGGIQVRNATTLEPVADLELPGFNRLNAAGDGRHVLVSTTGGFRVLDAGTWAEGHGDHDHYYTAPPALTDLVFPATKPGHVVVHDGRTVLFDDGTGTVVSQDSTEIASGPSGARTYTTRSPHHGVAVELADGRLVVSDGTEESRSGVRLLDGDDRQLAETRDCPGVHGEAVAADDTVVIGCQDGAVVVRDGAIRKVDSPDDYGRIGNQAGTEASPIVLGDYKTDEDAELERPTRVSLIDTRTGRLRLVDLPSSYTFRSLGRGADGEALVLGTDGALHVIDPESAKITRSVPVLDAWTEPDEWQTPRPTLRVLGSRAFITDPATGTLSSVDYRNGRVARRTTLDVTPNEIEVATGEAPPVHDHPDASASPSGSR